eukprot:TRINITY_DN100706_c0_g1_i1.p1 TRINITY_DN100706_c0_g1~~TRINITY_DN100706_c0_g1_i1.p1  ORF type:complete len:220 (+),score=41.23 TRINITY_DN100706_c0_g1_i1:61-660(+)
MAGKDCIAIASDTRFGIQQQTVSTNMKKVFKINDKTMIGMTGLISDMQTLVNKFKYRQNLYEMSEGREMKCNVFANMVSAMLYERRFGPYFMEPVVAGLQEEQDQEGNTTYSPFLCGMDMLGAPVYTNDFMVAGTTSDELHGVCEAMYRPDMEADDLFETISQCLLAAQDRDCLAGWGAVVHIITPTGTITRELKARQD